MLLSKRHNQIMNLLQLQGSVSVQELSEYLDISSSTIRRDLTILEKDGYLIREHGGAKLKENKGTQSVNYELPIKKKKDIHQQEKDYIARYASQLINDGDCIYIDSGSTPAYIYEYIRNKKITVVTNNLSLLERIKEKDKASVIFGAGTYNYAHNELNGILHIDVIKQFQFTHAFIGCSGFNTHNYHCTCTSLENSSYKNYAMQQSHASYLVADASKRYEEGIICFSLLSEFTKILTTYFKDEQLPDNVHFCSQ